jgi:hypothetical protein
VTLYLKATIGKASYVIVAAQVTDVRPVGGPGDGLTDDEAIPLVDCRLLFGETTIALGYRIVVAREADQPTALIVDRLDGLIELGDEMFRALPAIGRFGTSIDAVSLPVGGQPPALRLRVGSALLAEAQSPARPR